MGKEDVLHTHTHTHTHTHINTMGYHLVVKKKKNKIMPFAATCMNLEIIKPSDISQTEKENYHR